MFNLPCINSLFLNVAVFKFIIMQNCLKYICTYNMINFPKPRATPLFNQTES
jgi:hypothetical protein